MNLMLTNLIILPLFGVISVLITYSITNYKAEVIRIIGLSFTILNLIISIYIYLLYDFSTKQFQYVEEKYEISNYDFFLGLDGLSIYFVLLTTIIMPIALISNWKSIKENIISYVVIILLLESLLLLVFLVLDTLLFYMFFESILAPLFLFIGILGSKDKIRASFYFFLYTFLGSLFMLLSILTMLSLTGTTNFEVLSKSNFLFSTQIFLFLGIFVAFSVKTPVIYLNSWLLKAHVESPLSGSIILAAIVLKLSLYGVFRLILPLMPKAYIDCTYIIFIIGVLTILYASFSTIRTIDVKELIAYSSVSHAAVYFAAIFSNVLQGVQGGITLGLAHGFVSSGLFICAGGILYDRSHTRLIHYYRGIAQIMPIFSILLFILSLGNCGAPLTLNFIGEFMSLYGIFERLPLAGILASSSIIFSGAYTIYMFNRIAFGGYFFNKLWDKYIPDLNKREFFMLIILILPTILFGIYPSIILDALHFQTSYLLYGYTLYFALKSSLIDQEPRQLLSIIDSKSDSSYSKFEAPEFWGLYLQDNTTSIENLEELHNNIMFYLAIILFAVSWTIFSYNFNYIKQKIEYIFLDPNKIILLLNITPFLFFTGLNLFRFFCLKDEILDLYLNITILKASISGASSEVPSGSSSNMPQPWFPSSGSGSDKPDKNNSNTTVTQTTLEVPDFLEEREPTLKKIKAQYAENRARGRAMTVYSENWPEDKKLTSNQTLFLNKFLLDNDAYDLQHNSKNIRATNQNKSHLVQTRNAKNGESIRASAALIKYLEERKK